MGKIKSKQVKRSVQELVDSGIELSKDFEMNKKILGSEMPSKKMRNKMAGYASRYFRQKEEEMAALQRKK
jgi:ribosomal protein S17E